MPGLVAFDDSDMLMYRHRRTLLRLSGKGIYLIRKLVDYINIDGI
jgi:hypothetical protein